MQLNIRFILHGVIVALAFMALNSSADDLIRLVIMLALCVASLLIERRHRT
jgi:hypothetical protein